MAGGGRTLPLWRAVPHLSEAKWAHACDLANLLSDVCTCACKYKCPPTGA